MRPTAVTAILALGLVGGTSAACDGDRPAAGRGSGGRGGGGGAVSGGSGGGASSDGTGGAGGGAGGGPGSPTAETTVVLFLVDGLMYDAVRTAAASGATNLAFVLANGVRVETSHSTSPAAVIQLPAGAPNPQPWGFASSGNVAVHTGCHLFESRQMDDIFLAAREAGIKSVFSGGVENYSVFTTPDFHYAVTMDDATTVELAIGHLVNDGARLLRLHLQWLRDFWTGPADLTDPGSAYIRHLVEVDGLLGRLIQTLRDLGLWGSTYLVVAADHGMADRSTSEHVASSPPSWNPFMAFYGPDLKRGTTIPYAELPDIAVTTMRFLHLPPLRGHLDPNVALPVRGPTGTVLTNLFADPPDDVVHPRYIETCLAMGTACTSDGDDYLPYRQAMLGIIH